MKVSDVMTKEPVSVESSMTIKEALNILLTHDVRHIPVLENGKLVGIVSDRDFRDYSLPTTEDYVDVSSVRARLNELVSKIMTSRVFHVGPDVPLKDVAELMIVEKFTAIPVAENDELLGIVSYADLLKVLVGKL